MKCRTIKCENDRRGHAATNIPTKLQKAYHYIDTSLEMIPFFTPLENCLLYARPHWTHTLLQLVFQKFQMSLKVFFVYVFVANSFVHWLAQNLQSLTDF